MATRPAAALHVLGVGSAPLIAATTTAAGEVLVVVPTDGVLMAELRRSPVGDVPARLTVTDRTPFPLRFPVRAQLDLSGWLAPVPDEELQDAVVTFAETCPADALFDVGLGYSLLRLDLAVVLLEEAGVTLEIEPEEFAAARPDPVSTGELDLMAEQCQPLSRLCERVQHWAGRHDDVRLLGIDRFGVRFRVEGRGGCYDLRVPFEQPVTGTAGLGAAVAHLLSCAA